MAESFRVLLIEDDKIDQMAFERFVKREDLPYYYQIAGSVSEARKVLAAGRFDVVLMDYLLGDGTAFDLFDGVGDAPLVVITGSGDEAIAVEAMKAGAYDYLIKDPEGNYLTTLPITIGNVIRRKRAEDELTRYRERLEELVEERTVELAKTNEQLLAEIAERERVEEEIEQRTEDLTLINALNNASNRGESLQEIVNLLVQETRRIFSDYAATVYLLSEDKKHLVMQKLALPPAVVKRIEKLIGMSIPPIMIPLKAGSLYLELLQAGKPHIINDPDTIQQLMAEFTATVHPRQARKALQRLIPRLRKIMGIRSVVNVPLVSEGEAIGLMDVASDEPFTESDLQRLEAISGQLTTIIERKQAEEEVRNSEERLGVLFELAPDGIYLNDLRGNFVDGNKAAEELIGYKKEELVGHSFLKLKLLPLDQIPKAVALLARNVLGRPTGPDELTLNRKDGGQVPVEIRTFPVKIKGQTLVLGIARDVTERKLAEESLQESEERFRSVAQTAGDAIITVDSRGNIVFWNQAAEIMFGYSVDEAAGKPLTFIMSERFREAHRKALKRVVSTGESKIIGETVEVAGLRKDGSKFPVELSLAAWESKGEGFFTAIIRDITERKRAEGTLHTLNAAAAAIQRAARTSEAVFTAVMEELQILGLTSAIYLLDETRQHYTIHHMTVPTLALAERLLGSKALGYTFSAKQLSINRQILAGETVFIPDIAALWAPVLPAPLRPLVPEATRLLEIPWGIAASLSVEEEVIGFLGVSDGRLTEADVPTVTAFANQMAAALENAHLFEQAQQEIAERKRAEEELRHSYGRVERALEGTIHALASALEMRDPYTAGHQRRVARLACAIGNEMGLSEEQIEGLRMAALIHDLGKINIPTEILSKPIRLNDLEWGIIKAHSQIGYDILKTVEFPWPVAEMVLQHHERLKGSGYPVGLSGEEIILEARILAVADVVEAMSSYRPYRPARGLDKALEEITGNRGILYDPEVVDVCLKLFTEEGFAFE